MKATDKFKLYLNSILNKIDGSIHEELWNKLNDVIQEQIKSEEDFANVIPVCDECGAEQYKVYYCTNQKCSNYQWG